MGRSSEDLLLSLSVLRKSESMDDSMSTVSLGLKVFWNLLLRLVAVEDERFIFAMVKVSLERMKSDRERRGFLSRRWEG